MEVPEILVEAGRRVKRPADAGAFIREPFGKGIPANGLENRYGDAIAFAIFRGSALQDGLDNLQ